eukprot:gb/GECG01008873.1/.p1 GENE.gb/GECG01008873.1/~~gb/GECG01008873.1/.p1  ORF type:complete len:117 (+),score=18.05 gb/GECG01008873.1/:1-351(+)
MEPLLVGLALPFDDVDLEQLGDENGLVETDKFDVEDSLLFALSVVICVSDGLLDDVEATCGVDANGPVHVGLVLCFSDGIIDGVGELGSLDDDDGLLETDGVDANDPLLVGLAIAL